MYYLLYAMRNSRLHKCARFSFNLSDPRSERHLYQLGVSFLQEPELGQMRLPKALHDFQVEAYKGRHLVPRFSTQLHVTD